MTKPKSAASPVDRLAALTAERDRLVEQRAIVAAAPRSQAEAVADITKVIAALAARFSPPVGYLAGGPGGYGDLAHALGAHSPGDHGVATPAAALAWATPELLSAAIERDLVKAYEAMPTPMDATAKASELLRLGKQIASTEAEIAATWWSAVDAGMTLAPPDIPGPVLIGLDAP